MVENSALGADGLSRFPFIKEQASGRYLALCLIAVWLSRRHLGQVWRKVTVPLPTALTYQQLDDADEPMRYRTAVLGVIVGVLLIVWFAIRGACPPAWR